MSASTIPATANPPHTTTTTNNSPVLALGARRRNITVTEKKTSNIELLNDETLQQASSEKAKEIAKKALIGTPRPRRKPVTTKALSDKGEKGKFQTATRVFLKNFVLLIVLLGLVQLIGRMFSNGHKDSILPSNRVSEIEGRMNEIDSLLKKTSKMVQVQFDVVDKKIENEIGGVRRELMKQIEEKTAVLRKLESRSDEMEKSLSELGSLKYLTEDDLERFREELKSSGGEGTVSLDEIKSIARDIVFKEIEKHAADGQGMVDYALASAGAFVVSHSESLYPTGTSKWLTPPRGNTWSQKMLSPSFGEPGQCFPLKGSNGFVEIRLRTEIIPEAVTLEHVAKTVAFDRSSAPKDCKVTGLLRARGADQSIPIEKKVLLAEFTYDLEKNNVQTFNVDSTDGGLVNIVRFDFTSNYGAAHTCIYRFRVHGYEPDSASVSTVEP